MPEPDTRPVPALPRAKPCGVLASFPSPGPVAPTCLRWGAEGLLAGAVARPVRDVPVEQLEGPVFAVKEVRTFEGNPSGAVSSFMMDPETGMPNLLSLVSSGAGNPYHLSVSPCNQYLMVANHESASVAVFPIDREGRLVPFVDLHQDAPTDPTGKRRPHAHFVTPDPGGNFVVSSDTGTGRITVYRLDSSSGILSLNDPPWGETHPGGSPRHLAFSPSGQYLFANGEADLTLSVFRFHRDTGELDHLQQLSTISSGIDRKKMSMAQLQVHPNGRFVYVANRGHDSIALFEFDEAVETAARVAVESTRGKTPRNFSIDPSGRFLYVGNQNSNSIECFKIDEDTGRLSYIQRVEDVPAPTCLLFTQK